MRVTELGYRIAFNMPKSWDGMRDLIVKFYIICCTSAVNCLPLNSDNAHLSTDAVVYNTVVNITCQLGYQILENQYWVIAVCQADKSWSAFVTDCTGMYDTVYVLSWHVLSWHISFFLFYEDTFPVTFEFLVCLT